MNQPRCSARDSCTLPVVNECTNCGKPLCFTHTFNAYTVEFCEICCPSEEEPEQW